MKKFFAILVSLLVVFLTSAAFAADPCPPGKSCSENYMIGPVAPTKSSSAKIEKGKIKRIKIMPFAEVEKPSPLSAINEALYKAERWLSTQRNPERILGHAQSVSCSKPGNCTASVSVMYWVEEDQ